MTASIESVDLTNCDREPIHILDNIQPHGALLALDPADLTVLQASESTQGCFGVPATEVIARGLGALFDEGQVSAVRAAIRAEAIEENPLQTLCLPIGDAGMFDVVAHVHDGILILELEPAQPGPDCYGVLRSVVRRFAGAMTLDAFCPLVVSGIRRLSGFDRVMVYRFLEDGSGVVIAEEHPPGAEPFLGLHYPASDIPRQARALFVSNAIRIIPDAAYVPARIVPALSPRTGRPLDLTFAVLRGVSAMHTEYLANMGVRATMSLAITRGDTLWGLVACHHGAPRRLPYGPRSACEVLARMVSLQIADKVTREDVAYREGMQEMQRLLLDRLAQDRRLPALAADPALRSFVACGGAAVLGEGECRLAGETPTEPEVRGLVGWLAGSQRESVLATDSLPSLYPPAGAFEGAVTGLLALRLSPAADDWILWFRPAVVRTVHWAGDPNKPLTVGPSGARLTPRGSFALWKETMSDRARPFREVEREAAARLGAALLDIQRHQQLAVLNEELGRSNEELAAFAYVASHDLQEPIRGIHNYASFLLEDYRDTLDDGGQAKLHTLLRLTTRMRSLLSSLLHISRVGSAPLALEAVDLNEVVEEAREGLGALLAETGATLILPRPLPSVTADRVQLVEVLGNLVSNAAKYSDKPDRRVEIGYADPEPGSGEPRRFYVKDNGLGIAERHHEAIFRIFKRLHPRERFGGDGVGLTIAQRIVERHGGRIWLASTEGAGTTFWFTLERAGRAR